MLCDFVVQYIRECAKCQSSKTIHKWFQPPLQPITTQENTAPFAMITMDFVVKLPELKGSDSILTITD